MFLIYAPDKICFISKVILYLSPFYLRAGVAKRTKAADSSRAVKSVGALHPGSSNLPPSVLREFCSKVFACSSLPAKGISMGKDITLEFDICLSGGSMRNIKLDKEKCLTCKRCQTACIIKHSSSDVIESLLLEERIYPPRIAVVLRKDEPFLIVCRNCEKPKCVDACKHNALEKLEDGTVFLDEQMCKGCWKCIEACPFDAIQKSEFGIAVKCDSCRDLETPACVSACHVNALEVVS